MYNTCICMIMYDTVIVLRSEETLHVDISATAIKPSLILVTNNGCATIDFGDVGVGKAKREWGMTEKCIIGFVRIRVTGSYCRKSIEVKNISSQSLKVKWW